MAGLGTPSWKDFVWDLLGTAVGLALAFGIDRLFFWHPKSEPAPAAAPADAQSRRGAPTLLESPFVFAPVHPW
ncbi:MAG: hypothetical protein QM765_07580 [Myxococcales bacterium]